MKHKRFAAVVLAAALWLTGCGGAAAPAAPAGSGAAAKSTASTAVQTAQKERITDQYTLEKDVSGVWDDDTGEDISVHVSVRVPQLECDSPDAASINEELNDIYAAHFREYETYEEAGQPGSEYPQIGVGWDATWYGDCVSLVVHDRYDGSAPWYSSGWCFDFATGQQLTVAEMLQRMGLDPDEVQTQAQRQAMQAFDREMAQSPYYESWRLDGDFSQMRMGTLECNEVENLCLLLPEQNQLVIRSRYGHASEGGGMAAAGYGDPADPCCPHRPRRHPGADRHLRRGAGAAGGNTGHHHPPPRAKDRPMGRLWHPGGTGAQLPHPWHL